jgi:mannose-6-phosphate isomerase
MTSDKLSGTSQELINQIEQYVIAAGFRIADKDLRRPWGGFLALDETQSQDFANKFFPEVPFELLKVFQRLSPKILIVSPGRKLSWQYHHRRAEIWKLIGGTAGIVRSDTDTEGPLEKMIANKIVTLSCGERHRLVGLDSWGVVAEIWQHTHAENPSDENDIVRVQDDFGR